jgi:hypothetical protein
VSLLHSSKARKLTHLAQNKEAEAKEELKRRAKQLEMQRREQQRRTASGGGGGGGMYGGLGGGMSGYSAVPQRYDTPDRDISSARAASPAPSAPRAPAFKGSGMKLGSKKVGQDQLLNALGNEVKTPDVSARSSPAPRAGPKSGRGSLPAVDQERLETSQYAGRRWR